MYSVLEERHLFPVKRILVAAKSYRRRKKPLRKKVFWFFYFFIIFIIVAAKNIIDAAKSTPLKVIRDIGFSFVSFQSLSTIDLHLSLIIPAPATRISIFISGDDISSSKNTKPSGSPLLSPNQIIDRRLLLHFSGDDISSPTPIISHMYRSLSLSLSPSLSDKSISLCLIVTNKHISFSLSNCYEQTKVQNLR